MFKSINPGAGLSLEVNYMLLRKITNFESGVVKATAEIGLVESKSHPNE
jgi:hypothetical protein